jgi:hypothetical protein
MTHRPTNPDIVSFFSFFLGQPNKQIKDIMAGRKKEEINFDPGYFLFLFLFHWAQHSLCFFSDNYKYLHVGPSEEKGKKK